MLNTLTRRILAASIALVASAAIASAQTTVRYATDGYGMGSTIVLASEKGYLMDEGINPVIQTYAYGVDTIDAVLAGQADFGVVIGFPLLIRFQSGKLIAPSIIGNFVPGWHKLYTRTELMNADEFEGKSFAVATGTAQEFVTRNYIKLLGLDPETDVKLVDFGDLFSIVGALKSGRIDAAWVWGEGAKTMSEDANFAFISDDSIVSEGATALLVTTKEYASANHDAIVRTLKALQRATEDVAADSGAVATIVADKLGADSELVKRAIDQARYELSFTPSLVDNMRAQHEFLLNAGMIESYDLTPLLHSKALAEAIPSAEIDASLE
ncbi:MAG: ABC transporter substrate-binding protein [Paracoccaceae bacterium]|nr:ABC transporter substrate-binding protein [Paracoccaceae bacterium]MDE2911609.1 ABC transporter substrate-binding protein [Paracoccaceae bacterium]